MGRLLRLGTSLGIVALASSSYADNTTPNYLPFGERAAMLGNAGFTSPQGEAVYYNPANLGRIDYPSLSVSGSTFLIYDLSVDPYAVVEGVEQPFSASGFVAIPSSLISTYQFGKLTLATAILVPDALTYKNRQTYTFADEQDTILQEVIQQSLWLGVGAGREIAPNLYAGISAFVARDTASQVAVTSALKMSSMARQQSSVSTDTAILNLVGILGIQWQPTPAFGIGLRAQLPTFELSGTQDFWASTIETDEMGVVIPENSTEVEFEDVHASNPTPTDLGLGVSFRPVPRVELLADLGVQLPKTFTTLEIEGTAIEELELETAVRVSLGAELEVGTNKWLRLGGMYNRSANVSLADGGPGKDNYLGFTAGFSFLRDRTITSIGVFGAQSKPETYALTAETDPPQPQIRADARIRLYGALIAISYRL
ncbi:MAG: hypothetical protein AB7P03_20135 [Kofleriaceae bacterium]